ncbi:multicopper oxidase domain-containing protein [Lewinella sp.]|uniref:multicopper oxidase domain-containing protein n=1 Tax=Lewinella sp. TaxID=2004506 RepID=UPI003D6B9D8D
MKRVVHLPCFLYLMFVFTMLNGQQEHLIIGRTTGEIFLNEEKIRVFGFTNTLSGQVTLPGTTIDVMTGDSIVIDFWNISQGDPHVVFMDSISLKRRTSDGLMAENQAVYHMDHGYYHFTAPAPGTYLYYCSENFPVNLRAGMFGVMIVRSEVSSLPEKQELLWCSFEMDLVWQELALLDTENDLPSNELPAYKPQHFLLNGKPFKETEPIALKTGDSSEPILIRLVNAGQWQQEISFPKNFRLQLMDNGKALLKSKRFQQLILAPRETCELLVHPPFMDGKDRIKYIFRDPVTGRIKHRTFLSIY